MDLDPLKKKRYNLHTVSREKNKHIFLSNSNSSSPSSTSPINTPIVTFHRDKRPANCTTKTRKQRLRASERSRSGHRDRWEKKKKKNWKKRGGKRRETKEKTNRRRDKKGRERGKERERERRISIGGGGRATAAFRGRRNRRDGAGEGRGGEERVEARLLWLYPYSGRGVKITNELSRWALSRVRPRGYGNRLCSPTTPFYESASLPPPPLLRSRVRGPAWILPIYVVEERTVLT